MKTEIVYLDEQSYAERYVESGAYLFSALQATVVDESGEPLLKVLYVPPTFILSNN